MGRTSKTKTQEPVEVEKKLEQLILDKTHGKYEMVPLAAAWSLELRRREEYRHLTQNEILDLALRQLLTGKVDAETVQAAAAAARSAARSAADGKESKK